MHTSFAQLLAEDCSRENLLVYADWLEEAGDERAEGVRELARLGKRPAGYMDAIVWWNSEDWGNDEPDELPGDVWRRLGKHWLTEPQGFGKAYATRAAAINAAAAAIVAVRKE